jgi:hypothetical protein
MANVLETCIHVSLEFFVFFQFTLCQIELCEPKFHTYIIAHMGVEEKCHASGAQVPITIL